ncbi:MAG: hypothetical protein JW904_01620 [Spirochaetales bacterium]|nr:hypothetical protein [Spirochaetales bacterium]
MNPFLNLVDKNKIASQHELKIIFWQLARECHPDTGKLENGEKLFKKLKQHYDEAFSCLTEKIDTASTHPLQHEPGDLPQYALLFCDLVSSNFPVDRAVRDTNRGYCRKLEKFTEAFSKPGNAFDNLFSDCEKELYEIRGENIVMNQLFGAVKLILYNICSCYYLKNKFTKTAVKKWLAEITPQLTEKNYTNTKRFLEFFVGDMENVMLSD